MNTSGESAWLPDYLYREGRFEANVAMQVGSGGRIERFAPGTAEVAGITGARPLSGRALLPGMVNVHSHSFQRAIRGRTEGRSSADRDTFWTWREAMYHAATALSPDDIYDVARMAFLEMLLTGITAVGEFHYLHRDAKGATYDDPNLLAHRVIDAARDVGIRIQLQRTAYVRAGWRKDPNPGQIRFLTPRVEQFIEETESLAAEFGGEDVWVGVAPHSVRAVPLDYLKDVAEFARARGLMVHMHVSEQPAEVEACLGEHGARPVELLEREGVLSDHFTGIHVIHIDDGEVSALSKARARVCACPTTERNLGDGIGPAEQWYAQGVGVCFGSDSNAQIDLLEDARQLEYHSRLARMERAVLAPDRERESLAQRLFGSATEGGAASIGGPGGSLREGRAADFFTVDLDDPSIAGAEPGALLTNIVFAGGRTAIRNVYVAGRCVVEDGRHARQEEIVNRFAAVQRKLWGPTR